MDWFDPCIEMKGWNQKIHEKRYIQVYLFEANEKELKGVSL